MESSTTHNTMDHLHFDNDGTTQTGIILSLLTIMLYVLSILSLQQWAAIGAMLAGFTTATFNGYKFYLLIKGRKKRKP